MKVFHFKIYIVAFLTVLTGCSYSGGAVESYIVDGDLPQYIVVNLSEKDVRDKLLEAFNAKQLKDNIYYRSHGFKSNENNDTPLPLIAEDETNSIWGNEFFSNPENSEKIFIHSMGASFLSSCYLQSGKPIGYSATFYIEITSIEGKSKISVNSFDSNIIYGGEFNAHAMGWVPQSKKVEPSQIENYKLLAVIANMLGIALKSPNYYISDITTKAPSC